MIRNHKDSTEGQKRGAIVYEARNKKRFVQQAEFKRIYPSQGEITIPIVSTVTDPHEAAALTLQGLLGSVREGRLRLCVEVVDGERKRIFVAYAMCMPGSDPLKLDSWSFVREETMEKTVHIQLPEGDGSGDWREPSERINERRQLLEREEPEIKEEPTHESD